MSWSKSKLLNGKVTGTKSTHPSGLKAEDDVMVTLCSFVRDKVFTDNVLSTDLD